MTLFPRLGLAASCSMLITLSIVSIALADEAAPPEPTVEESVPAVELPAEESLLAGDEPAPNVDPTEGEFLPTEEAPEPVVEPIADKLVPTSEPTGDHPAPTSEPTANHSAPASELTGDEPAPTSELTGDHPAPTSEQPVGELPTESDPDQAATLPQTDEPPMVLPAEQAIDLIALELRAELARGQALAAFASEYVGTPYRWGGRSPAGFDCSGFTAFVYAAIGLDLPHDQLGQLASGRPIGPDELMPGDLLIFQNTYRRGPSHSGIYLGDGLFVHAATEAHGVTVSAVWNGYWGPRYYAASRPGR